MRDIATQTLLSMLKLQADFLQPTLTLYSAMHIQHTNDYYVDLLHQQMSLTGTEAPWLIYGLEHRFFQDMPSRLKPCVHPREPGSSWYQAYQPHRQQQDLDAPWLKTDGCVEGQHGYHLLEISHGQPLNLYQVEPLFDSISTFKEVCMRLQAQHLALQVMLEPPIAALTWPSLPLVSVFDLDQLEEPEPFALSALELQALDLRVSWHQDDELAERLQLSIVAVQELFSHIAA